MSFRKLQSALSEAGLTASAANEIARILMNTSSVRKMGPIEQDLTSNDLRSLTADKKTYQFPNFDFKEGNPDNRPIRRNPSENAVRPTPKSPVQKSSSSQQSDSPFAIKPGNFTEAKSQGDQVSVGLKIRTGGKFLTVNEGSEELVSKTLRTNSSAGEKGGMRLFVTEEGQEVVINLGIDWDMLAEEIAEILGLDALLNADRTPVVDQYVINASITDTGLTFTYNTGGTFTVPVTRCVTDESSGSQ